MRRRFLRPAVGVIFAMALIVGVTAGSAPSAPDLGAPQSHPLATLSPAARQALLKLPAEQRQKWDEFIAFLNDHVIPGTFSGAVQRELEKVAKDAGLPSTDKAVAEAMAGQPTDESAPDLRTQKAVADQVRANDDLGGFPQNEHSIEANPQGTSVIDTANDYRGFSAQCGVYTGSAGSNPWDKGDNHEQILPNRGFSSGDASVDWDTEGNAYVACLDFEIQSTASFSYIEVSKSTDKGKHWTFPVVADRGTSTFSFQEVEPGCFEFRFEERFLDKPYLSAGHLAPLPDPTTSPAVRNKVYVSYTEFISRFFERFGSCPFEFSFAQGENINVLRSPDGVNWKGPVTIDKQICTFPETTGQHCNRVIQGSDPYATHRDGKLYVAWYESTNDGWLMGRHDTEASRSLDGGATFDETPGPGVSDAESGNKIMSGCEISGGTGGFQSFVLPPTTFRAWSTMFPAIRTSHFDTDRIYVVHGSDPDSPKPECVGPAGFPSDDADVEFGTTQYADDATALAPENRVNDDTTNQDQFFGWLSVSGEETAETAKSADGEVVVVGFGDRRRDMDDRRYDYFMAASPDGPATTSASFAPNKRATSLRTSPNSRAFGGGFIGDYFGIDVDNGKQVYGAWMDARWSNESSCIPMKVGKDGQFDKNGELRCIPNLDEATANPDAKCNQMATGAPCSEGQQDAYIGKVALSRLLEKKP